MSLSLIFELIMLIIVFIVMISAYHLGLNRELKKVFLVFMLFVLARVFGYLVVSLGVPNLWAFAQGMLFSIATVVLFFIINEQTSNKEKAMMAILTLGGFRNLLTFHMLTSENYIVVQWWYGVSGMFFDIILIYLAVNKTMSKIIKNNLGEKKNVLFGRLFNINRLLGRVDRSNNKNR